MKNLVNYAKMYAKHGFYVLPMLNKKPLIKFADMPALTIDEIEKLWKRYPFAQIALRTVDFFVIDIDEHDGGADGIKSFNDYKKKHPNQFVETLSQKTAGGGKQLFYVKPGNMKIQQDIAWLPGVDIKAHNNNYVVVAPSEINNKKYEWLNKNPIVTPPDELIKAITQKKKIRSDFKPDNYNFNGKPTRTSKLFEQIVDGLGFTGGRNDALASFIGALLYRNVDASKVYVLAQIANENTKESLPDKEVNTTFQSMVKKEIRRREDNNGS
ncbi:bifunctional DNA primase/polymerase [Fructilactobacillus sp. Tb1]|uniref:bifunctional DNA primase/polymerase n=1 Tax=Fructilactobacillus sp. Tb1 TaxID=3422304 RepID=UPI003D2A5A4C